MRNRNGQAKGPTRFGVHPLRIGQISNVANNLARRGGGFRLAITFVYEHPRKFAVTRDSGSLCPQLSASGSTNQNPAHLLQNCLVSVWQEHLPRRVNESAPPPSLVLWIVLLELTGAFHTIRKPCDAVYDVIIQITRD